MCCKVKNHWSTYILMIFNKRHWRRSVMGEAFAEIKLKHIQHIQSINFKSRKSWTTEMELRQDDKFEGINLNWMIYRSWRNARRQKVNWCCRDARWKRKARILCKIIQQHMCVHKAFYVVCSRARNKWRNERKWNEANFPQRMCALLRCRVLSWENA